MVHSKQKTKQENNQQPHVFCSIGSLLWQHPSSMIKVPVILENVICSPYPLSIQRCNGGKKYKNQLKFPYVTKGAARKLPTTPCLLPRKSAGVSSQQTIPTHNPLLHGSEQTTSLRRCAPSHHVGRQGTYAAVHNACIRVVLQ